MTGLTHKRKKAEESSGDEEIPTSQPKARRVSNSTVKFASTVQAVSFDKEQRPKSIQTSRSAHSAIAPVSPDEAESPSPTPSPEPPRQVGYPYFAPNEVERLKEMATLALKETKKMEKEQLKQDLANTQKELGLAKYNLELCREFEKGWAYEKQKAAQTLKDADERTHIARVELQDALNELVGVRAEKTEMEKLLREKIEKETADAGNKPSN